MIVPKSKESLYRKMIRNALRCITDLQVDAEIVNWKSKKVASDFRIADSD
jgi:hypothetical protein